MKVIKRHSKSISLICFGFIIYCTNPADVHKNIPIVINEFMVRNTEETGIKDRRGNYEDWVELYNISSDTVNLSRFFISDRVYQPFKFQLPNVNIAPGEYFLLWGGKEDPVNGDHIGFSFSCTEGNDEKIIIFDTMGRDVVIVDSISFLEIPDACKKGVSYGRQPDGAIFWEIQSKPTPKTSNVGK